MFDVYKISQKTLRFYESNTVVYIYKQNAMANSEDFIVTCKLLEGNEFSIG